MKEELITKTIETLTESQNLLEAVTIQIGLTPQTKSMFKGTINDIDGVIREIKGCQTISTK
jgi:hypothetical protein